MHPEGSTSQRASWTYVEYKSYLWTCGVLGDQNRMLMYILFQAAFTVATMALTVMPRQVIMKEKKKLEMQPLAVKPDQPATVSTEISMETNIFTEYDSQSDSLV
ncbi:hypothetical protein MKX01_007995 [Papaver californicum]|nr:hypothetical protein MKX01_007995 [Papaver californicum]